MAETRGITAEMMTFFGREEAELPDGTVQVSYTGVGSMEYALGTYTALVKNGRAEISWSHDGEDISGGYEAEAWGTEQLNQMMADCLDEKAKEAFLKACELKPAFWHRGNLDPELSELVQRFNLSNTQSINLYTPSKQ